MKKIFLAFILIGNLVSCKKEEIKPQEATPLVFSRVKWVINNTNDTTFYNYDSSGRLIKLLTKSENSASNDQSEYIYESPTKIIQKYVGNSETAVITFMLNENGYAVTRIENEDTTFFQYDKNGFEKLSDNENLVVLNGNILKREEGINIQEFTYYSDKLNSLSYQMFGINFQGKDNVNLVKSEKTNEYKVEYSYEFDTKGRVVKCYRQIQDNPEPVFYQKYVYTD
jgi:hypothetical protein